MIKYHNKMVVAAEFNETKEGGRISANALFSKSALIGIPVSMNLLTNAIVKTVGGPEYDIQVNYQKFPQTLMFNGITSAQDVSDAIMRTTLLTTFLFPTIALYCIHPIQEILTNIKHLQRMNGVSGLSYWGTMYVADLIVYTLMTLLSLLAFYLSDIFLDIRLYQTKEIGENEKHIMAQSCLNEICDEFIMYYY